LLGKLGDEGLEPLLLAYLREPNPTLRWAAARALKPLATSRSEDGLTAALEDSDPRVQASAHEALLAIQKREGKKEFWTKSE
jgi:HEAT repeat protein